jgi:hypothetical protein
MMEKYDYNSGKIPTFEQYKNERDRERKGEKVNHSLIATYEAKMRRDNPKKYVKLKPSLFSRILKKIGLQ